MSSATADEALKSLVAGVPIPLLLIDEADRILATNDAAVRLFGPAVEARHYLTVIRQPAVTSCIEATRRTARETQGRMLIAGPSLDRSFRVVTTPVLDRRVLVSLEEITDVEQASRIRRDFVANVSHEMRTPLTALLGFIETLRGAARDDAAARERFLSIMAREAERMNRLVAELLSLTRVESEERVRPTAPVDLAALARSAAASLRPVAEAAGAEIELTGAAEPLTAPGDADQLTQVLTNLIENALKYGGPGRVTVALSGQARDPVLKRPVARIDVIDRGEGIDDLHLPRLTERFYRVDSHRSREKGGTGLGLAIVKHIVNRHRGRLKIESRKGQGSRFTVLLPRSESVEPES